MLVAALGTFGMVVLVLLATFFIVGDRRYPPYGLAAPRRYLVPLTVAPLVCVFCLFAWADLEREPSPSATGGTGLYAFTVVVGSVTVLGLVWSLLGLTLTTPHKQPRPPPSRSDRDPRPQARRTGHSRKGGGAAGSLRRAAPWRQVGCGLLYVRSASYEVGTTRSAQGSSAPSARPAIAPTAGGSQSSMTAAPTADAGVNGQVKVPTCGHEKSPPPGASQAVGRSAPPRCRASFMR